MDKSFVNISNYFKVVNLRNNKRIVVFLVCLMIATTLWLMNALSKEYSTTISYPVKFENPPENQFLAGDVPAKLELEVEGRGFTLLRFKLLPFSPVIFDIEDITGNMDSNSGTFRVATRNLRTRIEDQLSDELTISNINPEFLVVLLDSLSTKTVPVNLDIIVDFEPQYNLKSPITTKPDSVDITGPTILLKRISEIKTKVNIAAKLNSDINQEIELILPEKTTISPPKVQLNIEVEKYTEKVVKIPIEVLNPPQNASIKLFPSELKIVFTVGLSRFESISSSDFGARVDFNTLEKDAGNLGITLYKFPGFIQGIRLIPERVEFLIETN